MAAVDIRARHAAGNSRKFSAKSAAGLIAGSAGISYTYSSPKCLLNMANNSSVRNGLLRKSSHPLAKITARSDSYTLAVRAIMRGPSSPSANALMRRVAS